MKEMKINYTRNELISICDKAIVSQKKWNNRDSFSAHIGIGKCWVLLKSGCKFEILHSKHPQESISTDEHTIWIKLWAKTFSWFDGGGDEDLPDGYEYGDRGDDELKFYLPTTKRLEEAGGRDWY